MASYQFISYVNNVDVTVEFLDSDVVLGTTRFELNRGGSYTVGPKTTTIPEGTRKIKVTAMYADRTTRQEILPFKGYNKVSVAYNKISIVKSQKKLEVQMRNIISADVVDFINRRGEVLSTERFHLPTNSGQKTVTLSKTSLGGSDVIKKAKSFNISATVLSNKNVVAQPESKINIAFEGPPLRATINLRRINISETK